jgi:hypothetical protein
MSMQIDTWKVTIQNIKKKLLMSVIIRVIQCLALVS